MYLNESGQKVENDLPTIEQLKTLTIAQATGIYDNTGNYIPATSFEGFQYMSNLTYLDLPVPFDIMDTRPLSKLTNLETVFCYSFMGGKETSSYEIRNTRFDLNHLTNSKNLQNVTLYDAFVLDYSPLDKLEHVYGAIGRLESQKYDLPNLVDDVTISIDQTSATYKIKNPIKMPKTKNLGVKVELRFVDEEATMLGTSEIIESGLKEVHMDDDETITISNITNEDRGKKYLYIYTRGEGEWFNLGTAILIPILWY